MCYNEREPPPMTADCVGGTPKERHDCEKCDWNADNTFLTGEKAHSQPINVIEGRIHQWAPQLEAALEHSGHHGHGVFVMQICDLRAKIDSLPVYQENPNTGILYRHGKELPPRGHYISPEVS